MERRTFLALGAAAATLVASSSAADAAEPGLADMREALARLKALDGRVSYKIKVARPGGDWVESHRPAADMFVGSAIKTFILARVLKDVEEGRLREDDPVVVDDGVRSLSSPVLIELTGKTPLRSALEAMISHSDNTGTDIAMKLAEPQRVRRFLANAGLESARVPDSTRLLFSFLAGAPYGVDEGWAGMEQIMDSKLFGRSRSPMNDRETMRCSADDFVAYYERALAGRYFRDASTLTEFKRISAMADALPQIAPPDVAAYGKGGSIEWDGFNCICVPGQIRLTPKTPVTFCFTLNWDGPPDGVPAMQAAFVAAVRDALAGVAATFS
jgi:beta-lactamase class A